MNGELHFSFSTLNMLKTSSHGWINKMMKIKQEEKQYFIDGRNCHRIVQDHIGNIAKDPRIDYLTEHFPIVERKNFDPECKFTIEVKGYKIIGYYDAKDPKNKRFGELKFSGQPWSLGKFKDSPQRKIYALAEPTYTEALLITGSLNPDDWKNEMTRLKTRKIALTDQDRKEAVQWLEEALTIFENGDFNGGLNEEGRCIDRFCNWGANCSFRQ